MKSLIRGGPTAGGLTETPGSGGEGRGAAYGSVHRQDVDDGCLQLTQDQHQLHTHANYSKSGCFGQHIHLQFPHLHLGCILHGS